jgi:exodeoxyribonuclease VII small subunit
VAEPAAERRETASVPALGDAGGASDAVMRFEDALARLEQIVHALEAGNLSLDESLGAFEEGTGLLRLCTRRLDEAERRIEILARDEGGTTVRPFAWEEGQ